MTTNTSSSASHDASLISIPASRDGVLSAVGQICEKELRPAVKAVDEQGFYPETTMRRFGEAGLYAQHLSGQGIDSAIDMPLAIEAMALVGYECLSTAFCVWCHDACGWYLEKTPNRALRELVTSSIADGSALGATGLSNPMKFYSGIERLRVSGKRVNNGYVVNGSLPWVSNLGEDHWFGLVFECDNDPDHRVMALVRCDQLGVELCDGGRFVALEGSRTYATRFRDCFIEDTYILADPADEYIRDIRPGFVLMQVGMGIGLSRACAALMKKQDRTHWHVNQYLPHADELLEKTEGLLERTKLLASTPHETDREFVVQALQARLDAAELCLEAAEACMLSGGAKGYAESSPQFRKLREAYFVGVVTPAVKHLRKEIARLQGNEKDDYGNVA